MLDGAPQDPEGAQALFDKNPFEFEVWAVSLVDGQPNDKQRGDRGIDGKIRFPIGDKKKVGTAIVSVKGGQQINPSMVRDLVGTVKSQNAQVGLLVLNKEPTKGMLDAARIAGSYEWPVNGRRFPAVQLLTVSQLLSGERPKMPEPFLPYVQSKYSKGRQLDLL